jgi:hypothetical protein
MRNLIPFAILFCTSLGWPQAKLSALWEELTATDEFLRENQAPAGYASLEG